jgi:phosphoribosylamine--glycine ligase
LISRRTDFPALIDFAKQNDVGLSIIGPEAPLAAGIVDAFQAEGAQGFRSEQSGRRTRSQQGLLSRPAPKCRCTGRRLPHLPRCQRAIRYLGEREDTPIVVKADGFAAGKGVIVCENREQGDCRRQRDRT